MRRDAFGFERAYRGRTQVASRAREVFAAEPDLPRTLDRVSVEAFFDGVTIPERTFFDAVRSLPLAELPPARRGDFGALLRAAVRRIVESARRPLAVALSGGLDSAVVLALVREVDPDVRSLVLAPRMTGYSEVEDALATDARAETIAVGPDDFREQLPRAIAAMEVAIYNLHPVSKWLFARAAHARGIATVISGDAADHVFTRDVSTDYLPLVSAAFEDARVTLRTPFLDEDVVAHVVGVPPDRDKRELRDFARELGVRDALVREKKVSRLAPPIALDAVVSNDELDAVASSLGRPVPDIVDDRTRVRWTTLALLARAAAEWP
jgi:hypothetical protein